MNGFSYFASMMTSLFASASKIVFILIAMTLCAGFLWGHRLTEDHFFAVALSVFSYYYGKAAGSTQAYPLPGSGSGTALPDGPSDGADGTGVGGNAPPAAPMTKIETRTTSTGPGTIPDVK